MVDVWQQMDKVKGQDDELTGSGGSRSGSNYSDLTALENETDELGKRIIQHQRDAQRWRHALHDSRSIRSGARNAGSGLAPDADHNGDGPGHARHGSQGSADSEPPVTVPREWGRKGRKSATWMRRIRQPSEQVGVSAQVESQRLDGSTNGLTRLTYTSDRVERRSISAGNQALDLVGADTPPSMRRRGLHTPSSMQHMNTTLQHVMDTGDHDFTALSLFASTPAPSRLPRKIDEVSSKDGNGYQVRDTDAVNRTGGHGSWPSALDAQPGSKPLSTRIPHLSSPGRNKENVPPADLAGDSAKLTTNGTTESRVLQAVALDNIQRPKPQRDDSLGLLRKLARVSSMSPIPAGQQPPSDKIAHSTGGAAIDAQGTETTGKRVANVLSLRTANDVRDLRERLAAETVLKKQKAVRAVLSAVSTDGTSHTSKPLVIAAPWAETMDKPDGTDRGRIPTGDVAAAQHDLGPHSAGRATSNWNAPKLAADDSRENANASRRPQSALGDILLEAKRETGVLFGESTIQSLEDIIHPAAESCDPTSTADIDGLRREPAGEDHRLFSGQLSQPQKDRRQEDLAMESLNNHLRAARTSLKDANRGLRRVENQIETVQDGTTGVGRPSSIPGGQLSHAQCPVCAQRTQSGSAWEALWSEFRSLFWTWEAAPVPSGHHAWRSLRLTSLGFIVLAAAIWFFTEVALCEQYCHPLYASSMIDYGVDPDAPDFPFVIPTLLFRPFRWLWEPVIDALAAVATVLSHHMFGEAITGDNGSIRATHVAMDPRTGVFRVHSSHAASATARTALADAAAAEWFATAARQTARIVGSALDAAGDMGRLWEDE